MATGTDTLPLIRTKLYRPRITADLVPRPRLLDRLDYRRDRPLTLVVAPAGYGKTTLVTTWLATCDWPSAWLSLDEGDNDLPLFLSYFLAAIQTLFPGSVGETQALLRTASQPPLDVLAHSLINELDQIERPFVLVLDDYHSVQNMDVHQLLADLLRYPPRALHLALTSRSDPPLSLTTLRARGQATEIRAHELRFTEAETATFLRQLGKPADVGTVRALLERVEGWVTGIRLAVLSSRHRGSEELVPARLQSGIPYVTDYLLTEVLEGQPPAIQDYMLMTSVLDRFCAPLCEAVCPSSIQAASSGKAELFEEAGECEVSGRAYLQWLEVGNLFVLPLDDEHEWYRYHHLFQQLLRNQLQRRCGPDEIAAIHVRASAWFARNDLIDEALRHALEAGDDPGAAQLVEQNGRTLLSEDRWHALEKWLAKLPDDVIQQRPQLLIARAWVSYYHFALWAIPPILEAVEAILDDDATAQPSWGEVDFFWGQHWYWQGQSARSLDSLDRALERIPEAYHAARGEAELFWGLASQMSGQKDEAVQTLNSLLYYQQTPAPVRQIKLLGALVFVYMLSGELTEAAQVIPQLRDIAAKSHNTYIETWGSYLQGYVHYCWNDLGKAAHHLAQAVEKRYILHTGAAIDSLAGLALAYQVLGQADNARATMDLLLEFARETNDPTCMTTARSCQARVSLLQGDLASAGRWLQTADLTTDAAVMFYWLEVPRITQCRVLIAQGSAAGLQEGTERLEEYWLANQAAHNTRQMIDIALLQALAYQKQEQTDKALTALERAVTLAHPGGWIRPFVELGPMMASLLNQLRSRGVAPAYLTQILAAFPHSKQAGTIENRKSEIQNLVEPLTKRELEVLDLMAQRLTNKEIAAQMTITVGTVKQHAYNVYQKLNVKGRRQAVAKATSLGILSS